MKVQINRMSDGDKCRGGGSSRVRERGCGGREGFAVFEWAGV